MVKLTRTLPVITNPALLEAVVALVNAGAIYREAFTMLEGDDSAREAAELIRAEWGDAIEMAEGVLVAWQQQLGLDDEDKLP